MNEAVLIGLVTDGKRVPIDTFDRRGVVLRGERDAEPRDFRLLLWPASPVTARRVEWRCRDEGTTGLALVIDVQEGRLLVRGATVRGLPPGTYWVQPLIEDLKTSRRRFDLPEGKTAEATVEAQEDRRVVKLNEVLEPEIARLLDSHACELDGRPVGEWLRCDGVRAKRKACLLNVLTKLRCAPNVSAPLVNHVTRIFFCDVDRVYGEVDAQLLASVRTLARDPRKPFYAEGTPVHPSHRRLVEHIGEGGRYTLESYRQEGAPSMQIVFAVPAGGVGNLYAEFDIDLANPLQDVAGLLVHAREVLDSARADHLALWKTLSKRREGKYLPYSVVKAA